MEICLHEAVCAQSCYEIVGVIVCLSEWGYSGCFVTAEFVYFFGIVE